MAEYHHNTYTPTADEMREAWVYMQWVETIAGKEIAEVQADNFFAAHDRQVAAKAWDEGHAAGRDYQGDGWNSDAHDPEDDNPYRSTVKGEGN